MNLSPFVEFILFTGDDKVVEILVQNGADVNSTNTDEETPLHIATLIGRDEIVDFLIKSGADVNRKDKNEKTALDIAVEKGI